VSDPVSFDPRDRLGRIDELWGNLVLPEGSAEVDTRFVFAGEGDTVYRVSRVNVFPQDPSKRLYYYLRTNANPHDS
jgi:hypothetical protein